MGARRPATRDARSRRRSTRSRAASGCGATCTPGCGQTRLRPRHRTALPDARRARANRPAHRDEPPVTRREIGPSGPVGVPRRGGHGGQRGLSGPRTTTGATAPRGGAAPVADGASVGESCSATDRIGRHLIRRIQDAQRPRGHRVGVAVVCAVVERLGDPSARIAVGPARLHRRQLQQRVRGIAVASRIAYSASPRPVCSATGGTAAIEWTVQRRTSGPSTTGTSPMPGCPGSPTITPSPASSAARANGEPAGSPRTSPGAGSTRRSPPGVAILRRTRRSRTGAPPSCTPGHPRSVASAVSASAAPTRCIGAHCCRASITSSGALSPASQEAAHTVSVALENSR